MSLIELYIELFFDVIALLLGITLLVRKDGNQQRFYWGIISIFVGGFLMWENLEWIFTLTKSPDYEYQEIFNLEKMLKWFAPASLISLFPLASLRPGYLNLKRIIIYFLPFLVVFTITVCYLSSNQTVTKLYSLNEVFLHLNNFDIKLRLSIFLFSLFIPFSYFFSPLIIYKTARKVSFNMYLFLAFNISLSCIYVFFTLSINSFFFNALGILSVIFAITFSIVYLRSENPLSIYIENTDLGISATNNTDQFFFKLDVYMKGENPFINSGCALKDIAETLGVREQEISRSVKSAGFTGFREYLNFLRLEYFKMLASQNPNRTIKELMFASGFTSRTTFYRVFAEQYGISPAKYIENLKSCL